MKNESSPQPVLQASLRRSGSTLLYRALDTHPDVVGVTEPWSFYTRKNNQNKKLFDSTDPLSPVNHSTAKDFDPNFLHTSMETLPIESWWLRTTMSFFSAESDLLPRVRYAKETFANLHLGFLLHLLPESAIVIGLMRDLRGVVGSYKESNLNKHWNTNQLFDQFRQTVGNNEYLADQYLDVMTPKEDTTNWVELLVRKLIVLQSELEQHVSSAPNHLFVQFEDYHQSPTTTIKEILDVIGIPFLNEVALQAQSMLGENKPTAGVMHPLYKKYPENNWVGLLTLREQELIEELCSDHNVELKQVDKQQARNEIAKSEQTALLNKHKPTKYEPVNKSYERERIIEDASKNLVSLKGRNKRPFFMGKHLVTNNEFMSFLKWLEEKGINHLKHRDLLYHPARGKIHFRNETWSTRENHLDHPVVSVTWLGATAFGIWTGGRLPTNDEWLSATGGKMPKINYSQVNLNQEHGGTTPVKTFPANTLGLHDLIGNVREWTSTNISNSLAFTPGGSWDDSPLWLKNHPRATQAIVLADKNIGFRLASDTEDLIVIPEEESIIKIRTLLSQS